MPGKYTATQIVEAALAPSSRTAYIVAIHHVVSTIKIKHPKSYSSQHLLGSQVETTTQCENRSRIYRSRISNNELESPCGVKYTDLVRLEYLDLIEVHVIDPMHNLFLGTAKNMLKTVWQRENTLSQQQLETIQSQVEKAMVPPKIGKVPNK